MPSLKLRHVLILAFLVRLILIPFFSDDFNYWAVLTFTRPFVNGYNPWTVTYNDPCLHWINPWRNPPLQLYLVFPPLMVNEQSGNYILMLYAMKLPLVLVDILSIFFVYRILQMWSDDRKRNIRYLSIFAFNPISILASAVAGSTDPLTTLFMIVSFFYFVKPTENTMTERNVSALFLGMAIAAKLFPVVFVPIFLLKLKKARDRIIFTLLSLLPLVLFSLPFLLWDYTSYVNTLLHNFGGYQPFVTFLNPSLSVFLSVPVAFFSVLMFAVSYIRKTDILANLVMAFLALYALAGFAYFDTKYFSWLIPFAVLLISRKETRIPGADFLPFIYIPSLVRFLIYNGPYNAVEGTTGFFYFAYHWLRQKVVVFNVLPFSDFIYFAAGIATIFLIGYYFLTIAAKAHSFSFPAINFTRLKIIQNIKKSKKSLLTLFLVTLVSIVAFAKVVPYETYTLGVDISNSTLHFYDDFSRSLLNSQWGVTGNGNYTIHYEKEPSYISLNGNITVYRGWGPIWQGFKESGEAEIKLIYKLDQIPAGAVETPILVSNGGLFEVVKENNAYVFVYFDGKANKTSVLASVDFLWHELRIHYGQNGRLVSLDGNSFVNLSNETFSFICFGLPIDSNVEMKGCSFSVSSVDVTIQGFYSGAFGEMYSFLALFVPSIIITSVLVFILKRNQNARKL